MSEWRVVALGSYTGRAVPGADTVILAAVTWARALHEALSTRADWSRLELPDAEHKLNLWFRDHLGGRAEFGGRATGGAGQPVGTLPGAAVDQRL
ncbi:hypothetical protein [Streptomyces murinus]|uniref:hypothetical protein n=1 Tax=Streptomyces murinus TaxID=33900 RepID=UPI0036E14DBF